MDSREALREAAELFHDTAAPRRVELLGLLVRHEITREQRAELQDLDTASVAIVRWLEGSHD